MAPTATLTALASAGTHRCVRTSFFFFSIFFPPSSSLFRPFKPTKEATPPTSIPHIRCATIQPSAFELVEATCLFNQARPYTHTHTPQCIGCIGCCTLFSGLGFYLNWPVARRSAKILNNKSFLFFKIVFKKKRAANLKFNFSGRHQQRLMCDCDIVYVWPRAIWVDLFIDAVRLLLAMFFCVFICLGPVCLWAITHGLGLGTISLCPPADFNILFCPFLFSLFLFFLWQPGLYIESRSAHYWHKPTRRFIRGLACLTWLETKKELRERERKSNEEVVEQADFLDLYPPNGFFLSQLRRKRCGK